MIRFWSLESDPAGQGRIAGAKPVAVLDIGSNSVRLVVYERLARALTVLYNEKSSSALGRGVAATGLLAEDTMASALKAIERFAVVIKLMGVGHVHAIATSATREARNGAEFTARAEAILGESVRVLSGEEEAHFGALGVISGMPEFVGVMGDLGGGSLELSKVHGRKEYTGDTFELGVIRLQDDSNNDPELAASIVRERLLNAKILLKNEKQSFAAIGGTWRALAKLHQVQSNYPMHMVQEYCVKTEDILPLCDDLISKTIDKKVLKGIETVSGTRKELLPFGAAVLSEVLKAGRFEYVIFSATGVREGFLFEQLPEDQREIDPLLQACEEISLLRSRAPEFVQELIHGSTELIELLKIEETAEEERLRYAACLLSDISWRGHPDYRGEQSIDMIAFSDIAGIGHPGRAFLSKVMCYRYAGLKYKSTSQELLDLAGEEWSKRAKLIAAYFRVVYPLCAAMPDVLPRTELILEDDCLVMYLPSDMASLDGERIRSRLKQLASEAGFKNSRIDVR